MTDMNEKNEQDGTGRETLFEFIRRAFQQDTGEKTTPEEDGSGGSSTGDEPAPLQDSSADT